MGKALEVQAAQETMGETIEKGGIVGHCILGLGAIALALTIFKFIEITRFAVPSRMQINAILDDLLAHNTKAAMAKADALPGMAGDLVRTGVVRFHEKRRVLEEALFEKMVTIKPRLDRFLPFLGLTAAAAPLMGLLGTVLGIIKTFQAMAIYGTGNAKNFSAGISEALITTAEGLIVAIPVLVLHGMMKSLAKGKFGEVEAIAIAMMNGTTEIERRGGKASDEEPDDDIQLSPTPA
jgi:biopolymer transport protein ExbB